MFAPMFERRNRPIVLVLCLLYLVTVFASIARGQDETAADEKIIERYKLMLERKPKEGSTFDRLYQFYLEGAGLEQMVADYQTEVAPVSGSGFISAMMKPVKTSSRRIRTRVS